MYYVISLLILSIITCLYNEDKYEYFISALVYSNLNRLNYLICL